MMPPVGPSGLVPDRTPVTDLTTEATARGAKLFRLRTGRVRGSVLSRRFAGAGFPPADDHED